jgi:hypothetical protein
LLVQPFDAFGLPDDVATKVKAHGRTVTRIVDVVFNLTALDGLSARVTFQSCSIARLDRPGNKYRQSTHVDALANARAQSVIPQLRFCRHVAPPRTGWYTPLDRALRVLQE